MPTDPFVTIEQIIDAATALLIKAGADTTVAASVAHAIVNNEAQGNTVCGLYYLPVFVEQLKAERVNGNVQPQIIHKKVSSLTIDAQQGFAQPAIDLAISPLTVKARETGIAACSIVNSYNALSLGSITERLAQNGCLGLAFSNAPAAIAPDGASRKIFGTNPFSLAVPNENGAAIVIDQSASIVTKTEILMRAEHNEEIPSHWARDDQGKPTNDSKRALQGYILPSGGIKGANIALMVEILSAVLTGSMLSVDAEQLGDAGVPHPKLGQFIIAIDLSVAAHGEPMRLIDRLVRLFDEEKNLRLPGERRKQKLNHAKIHGIQLSKAQRHYLQI